MQVAVRLSEAPPRDVAHVPTLQLAAPVLVLTPAERDADLLPALAPEVLLSDEESIGRYLRLAAVAPSADMVIAEARALLAMRAARRNQSEVVVRRALIGVAWLHQPEDASVLNDCFDAQNKEALRPPARISQIVRIG